MLVEQNPKQIGDSVMSTQWIKPRSSLVSTPQMWNYSFKSMTLGNMHHSLRRSAAKSQNMKRETTTVGQQRPWPKDFSFEKHSVHFFCWITDQMLKLAQRWRILSKVVFVWSCKKQGENLTFKKWTHISAACPVLFVQCNASNNFSVISAVLICAAGLSHSKLNTLYSRFTPPSTRAQIQGSHCETAAETSKRNNWDAR